MVYVDFGEGASLGCVFLVEFDLVIDGGKGCYWVFSGILCLPYTLEFDQIGSEDASLLVCYLSECREDGFV